MTSERAKKFIADNQGGQGMICQKCGGELKIEGDEMGTRFYCPMCKKSERIKLINRAWLKKKRERRPE